MIDKNTSVELTPLKAQVSKLENRAQEIQINNEEDYRSTADLIAKLKETGSRIKNIKESITKPLNEALRNTRELFAPIESQFTNAESIVKTKILEYKRKIDAEVAKQEAKIAKGVESGRLKIETAEKKLDQIERVENTTKGKIGEVQIRKIKKVRIIDINLLPREYLIPNDTLIRKDALGGKKIEGVEIYEEDVVAGGMI